MNEPTVRHEPDLAVPDEPPGRLTVPLAVREAREQTMR
jgi:hypothetical protein